MILTTFHGARGNISVLGEFLVIKGLRPEPMGSEMCGLSFLDLDGIG